MSQRVYLFAKANATALIRASRSVSLLRRAAKLLEALPDEKAIEIQVT